MKIVLVRHGRSGHVQSDWIHHADFLRWREAYEAAGIDMNDIPPPELRAIAAASGAIVASIARRAIESAQALAPDGEIATSPLLRELDLHPPPLGPIRLPLLGWAFAYGARWLVRAALRRPHVGAHEVERARAAAEWLSQLAMTHESVVAVTHASFRSLLARELAASGWRCDRPGGRARHWSAWTLTR